MNNLDFHKNQISISSNTDLSSILEAFPNAVFAIDHAFMLINYNQPCKETLLQYNFICDDSKIVDFINFSVIPFIKNDLQSNGLALENLKECYKTTFFTNKHNALQIHIGKAINYNNASHYLVSLQITSNLHLPENSLISSKSYYAKYIDTISALENCISIPDIYTIFSNQLFEILGVSAVAIIKNKEHKENKIDYSFYSEKLTDKEEIHSFETWINLFFSSKYNDIVNETSKDKLNPVFLFNNGGINSLFTARNNNNIYLKHIKHVYFIRMRYNSDISSVIFIGTQELIEVDCFLFLEALVKLVSMQIKLIITQNQLQKTKEISNQFFELNPYSIAMADSNGYFLRANKAFVKLWGNIPPKDYDFFNDPILKSVGLVEKIKALNKKEVKKIEIPPFWYNPNAINPQFPDSNRCVEGNIFNITNNESGETEYFVVMQHDITEKEIINQKLQQSEEKYRKIFEHIQDVYFEVDHQNIIREISPSVELYTLYKREEIINTSFLQYLVEPERMTDFFENLFKYKKVRDSEIKIYDKNKEIVTCASNCILVPGVDEKSYMIVGSFMNITDLKKVQNELIETQYKYSEIINNIGQGIGILDETETFIFANPAANQIFETKENSLIGKNIAAFVDKEQFEFIRQQTIERKKGYSSNYSLKITTAEGKTKYINITANPQFDKNTNFYGSLGIFQDISESQFLHQELQKSEEKYREIFENANDIIYTMDLNGNFSSINPIAEKILGYSAEEIKQIYLKRIVDSTNYHLSQNNIMEAVQRNEQHSRYEIDAFTKDGRKVVFDINSFLKFKDGKPYEIFGIARDITARKMAEYKMMEALAEKEVLLREVHHRVKNNLQVIMSLINFQITDDLEINVKEKLKELRERIHTMSLIHEDLYISEELAKVEFGVYLEKLINNVSNVFDAAAKGIIIVLETKVVIMDIEKAIPCGMIVNEMLSNALKYAFPSDWRALQHKDYVPAIKISFKISKGIYTLTFEDNGIGLPEKIEKKKKNTLGLWLINILTKDQLNGKITINRKNGTKFSVKFLKIQEKSTN